MIDINDSIKNKWHGPLIASLIISESFLIYTDNLEDHRCDICKRDEIMESYEV